jgi:hypothetical protein
MVLQAMGLIPDTGTCFLKADCRPEKAPAVSKEQDVTITTNVTDLINTPILILYLTSCKQNNDGSSIDEPSRSSSRRHHFILRHIIINCTCQ